MIHRLIVLYTLLLPLFVACNTNREGDSPISGRSATEETRLFNAIVEVGIAYNLIAQKSEVGAPIPLSDDEGDSSLKDNLSLGRYDYTKGVILYGDIVTKKFGVVLGMPKDSLIALFGKPDGSYLNNEGSISYWYLSRAGRVTFEYRQDQYHRSIWET